MRLSGLASLGIDSPALAETESLSPVLDWATLAVAVIVGIGSAMITGWLQNRQLRTQRAHAEEDRRREERERRYKALVNYERALWEMVISIEGRENNTSHMPRPEDLDELRAEAYQYFWTLRDTGNEEDLQIYWRLFVPGGGEHESVDDVIESYTRSNQAARDLLQRFTTVGHRRSRGR